MSDDNIWTDEWDEGEDWSGGGGSAKRLPRAERLGATVDELRGARQFVHHFPRELVVLDGEMTTKHGGGRAAGRRETVIFPVGPAGRDGNGRGRGRALPVRWWPRPGEAPEVGEYLGARRQITVRL